MSKRLCQLNRDDITAQLGDVTRLVSAPKYICRNCARSSADKNTLCKPEALATDKMSSSAAFDVSLATEIAPASRLQQAEIESSLESKTDGKRLQKQAEKLKKYAEKQKKYAKKLRKAMDKQQKLLRKQQKLEAKFTLANQRLYQLQTTGAASTSVESLH